MGLLVDGKWQDRWYDTKTSGGKFVREDAQFRSWVTPDGSAGPTGDTGFKAESGRYHLYISHACPWAHRTLIFRELKELTDHIGVSAVHPDMLEQGWTFEHVKAPRAMRSTGRLRPSVSPERSRPILAVPILWDRQTETIVSNESSEIIRMLNSAFDGLTGSTLDLCPEILRSEIDAINERVYHTINNGCTDGFATSHNAYQEALRSSSGRWTGSSLS